MATITITGRAYPRYDQAPLDISVSGDASDGITFLLKCLIDTIADVGSNPKAHDIISLTAEQKKLPR